MSDESDSPPDAKKRKHSDESTLGSTPTGDDTVYERSTEYYLEDGNLEILSADEVLFKVKSYHLQAAS